MRRKPCVPCLHVPSFLLLFNLQVTNNCVGSGREDDRNLILSDWDIRNVTSPDSLSRERTTYFTNTSSEPLS